MYQRTSGLFVGSRPDPELFVPPTMERFFRIRLGKPHGGLWTSPETRPGRSTWIDWCRDQGYLHWIRRRPLWRLSAPSPRLYRIDSLSDLEVAVERWPHYPYRAWHPDDPFLAEQGEIDYPAMALEYDAVELTERGCDETRLTYPLDLNGWDVPSTLWLNWCFDRVERVRRT